jgi:cytochrome b6-f complex iron-sulfur subunit
MEFAVVLAVVILVVLAAVLLLGTARRRDRGDATGVLSRETARRDRPAEIVEEETVAPVVTGRAVERAADLERRQAAQDLVLAGVAAPAPYVPPDPEAIGVTRRQFLNRSIIVMFILGLSGFGASVIAFLWPQAGGGFGSTIRVGPISEVIAEIRANNGFLYKPEGRMWITEYPAGALEKARAVYSAAELAGMEAGVVALYQKCPHLGCRVPECGTSQWFECGCHGSLYNRVGEKKGGPAPRGMDRFGTAVSGGVLSVDTGNVIQGPAIGIDTTGQQAEGPSCLGDSSH